MKLKTKNKYKVNDEFFFIETPDRILIVMKIEYLIYFCKYSDSNEVTMYNSIWMDGVTMLATPLAKELYL